MKGHVIPGTDRPGGLSYFVIVILIGLVSACNPAPHYSRPTTPAPPSYKEAPPDQYKEVTGWKIAEPGDDKIRANWWEMYHDPNLNHLEEQVQISNQTIALAEANFRAARAVVVSARSALFPTVTTNPSFSNSRFAARQTILPGNAVSGANGGTTGGTATGGTASSGAAATGASSYNYFSLPIDVSYTVDLWHRVRNNIAANVYTAQARGADVATALLSTHSELAQDYFQVRAVDQHRSILERTIENYRQSLHLTTTLYHAGLASEEDVSQAQTQLNTAIAQATDLGVARAQYEHAIATLTGKSASEFSLAAGAFTPNPPAVPVGIPSEVLERRPDIASAERQVAAANAQIGVAKAAYYPNLTLSASAGFESTAIAQLFTWPSRFWSVGPVLAQTLFDAGARRGATEQAQAAYDAAAATYRQTVLSDFQAVEDNLAALRILAEEVVEQHEAVASSQYYLDLAMTRFRAGIDSYLSVITAQTTLLTNQITEVDIQLRQMTSSVGLIMSLGGGWDTTELPSVHEVSRGREREAPASAAPRPHGR